MLPDVGETEDMGPADASPQADLGADLGADAAIDMGEPFVPALEILSEPPEYGIVGVEYRYRPILESNIETLSYTLITAPAGATVVDGQIFWTPTDSAPGDFELQISGEGLSESQTFTVQLAEATTVASSTIAVRRGGTIEVQNTGTALDGLSIFIEAGALQADTLVSIASLSGPTEPVPADHVAHTPSFVILPELPGVELQITAPAPTGLAQDEYPLLMTAAAEIPLEPNGRGRYQDAVITMADLNPQEANTITARLKADARHIKLISGRYLRLEGQGARLYWNLMPGETPPNADAQRVMIATEQSLQGLTSPTPGCTFTSSISVFVVPFTLQAAGFAVPNAYYLRPDQARGSQANLEYVVAHEMVHVAQYAMLPGWRYNTVDSWWAEAMAAVGADDVFNQNTFAARYGPYTESLVTRGLIGVVKGRHQYKLASFFKHLKATLGFPYCRIMSTQSGLLAANQIDAALVAHTGQETVQHLSTFAAAATVYRLPSLIEDAAAMPFQFQPSQHQLGDEPLLLSFTGIAGAQAKQVSPTNSDPVTILARVNSSSGGAVRIFFFQEENGQLIKLDEMAENLSVLKDVSSAVTVVAASVDLSNTFSVELELTTKQRINGRVLDVNGQPVRAHVTLDEQPMVEDNSALLDGRFGLDDIEPMDDPQVTVRATCLSDPSLVATANADLSSAITVDVGTLSLTGECPSIEILEPSEGRSLGYGPYRVRGLTNLPYDRLQARINGFPNTRFEVVVTGNSGQNLKTFEGSFGNDQLDEGEAYLEVYSEILGAGASRVNFKKEPPRIWGDLQPRNFFEVANACPRVVTSQGPASVAAVTGSCNATNWANYLDRFRNGSCYVEFGDSEVVTTGDGRTRFIYDTSMSCMAADCGYQGRGACTGSEPFDMLWDFYRGAESGGDLEEVSRQILYGYDCSSVLGRAAVTEGNCPEGFDASCTFRFAHDPCRYCGDGSCGPFEQDSCAADCGFCGDGVCSADGLENAVTCAPDCESCGDGICSYPSETAASCAADCACGNGLCDPQERSMGSCPMDCD